jgi:hypothetical protein
MGALVGCIFMRAHCATSDAQEPQEPRFSGHHLAKHHQIWFVVRIRICKLPDLAAVLAQPIQYCSGGIWRSPRTRLSYAMRHNLCIFALWDPEARLPWARYLLSKLISKPPFYFNIPCVSPVLYITTDALHSRSCFSSPFLLN